MTNSFCAYCPAKAVMTDALGFKWCESHRFRGDLINVGAKYGYPDLQCFPYAIGAGEYCWGAAATIGSDELIQMALAVAQRMESPSVSVDTGAPPVPPQVPLEQSASSAQERIPGSSVLPSANATEQEVAGLRKEVRQLMPLMKPFFEENHHQSTQWESSGKMHANGKISEREYFIRVQNALRVGESLTLRDVLEAMHHTLEQGVTP